MKNLNKRESKKTTMTNFFKNIKVLSIVSFIGFALLTGCSEDDVADALGIGCGSSWEGQLEEATSDYIAALTAYSEASSSANCNNLKTATVNYYEEIEDIYDCIPDNLSGEYETYIDEAKKSLEQLDCN